MYRMSAVLVALGICALAALGCSSNGNNPLIPGDETGFAAGAGVSGHQIASTHLWGYFTVYVDIGQGTVEAVPDRGTMFSANVVNFLNSKPLAMSFKVNEVIAGADYTDVDINVGLTHPFPGMPQYNGYDVRGVFMGDGSAALEYNTDLVYPVADADQFMLDDPDYGGADQPGGGPDGYTRWYNLSEFSQGGMPLFNYTKGKLATPGFAGTATLCPYRYFADGLGTYDDLWTWINSHSDQDGVFSSGAKNERNYYLRFPKAEGIVYGYAVIANWEGPDPQSHPSNAVEAVACRIVDNSNVYYIDSTNNGGALVLDISVFDWGSSVSAGVMEDYGIIVESTALSVPYEFDTGEMTPVGGDENFSTYHVEIAADDVKGVDGNEYWVIVEYPSHDYTNEFGVSNLADKDALAAFFRYDLAVSPNPTNQNPVCDLKVVSDLPAEGWDSGVPLELDASGSTDPDGDALSFQWDFDGDGVYGENPDDSYEGADDNPTHYYKADYTGKVSVKVSDGNGGISTCDADVQVITHPSKNIQLHASLIAKDIAVDHQNGDLIVLFTDGTIEQTWKYPRSSFYQTGAHFYNLYAPTTSAWAIDVCPNRHYVTTGNYASNNPLTQVHDPDGNLLYPMSQGGPGTPSVEVFAIAAGDFTNDLGNILGWPSADATFAIRYPDGNWFYGHQWHYYWPTVYTGIDQIYYGYIKGVESDGTGNYLWYLEDAPEYYVSRWELSNSGFPYSQTYSGAYFGTGSQTNADNGWYSSRDITRDDQNRYFVLDRLSTGVPRVKMWTVSGTVTTSEGGFGDSTSISASPLRIEGSDWSGDIVVLHGNSAPYMVSVFTPNEMPD